MLAYIDKQRVLFLVLVASKYPDSDMWHINLYVCMPRAASYGKLRTCRRSYRQITVSKQSLAMHTSDYTQPCIRLPHLLWSCTLTSKTKYQNHSRNHFEFNVRISCIYHGYSGNRWRLLRDARTCVDIDVSCSASCSW